MHVRSLFVLSVLCAVVLADIHLDRLRLPPGFKIEVFIENVGKARQLTTTPDEQWLFIGSYGKEVFAYNLKTNKLVTIVNEMNAPIGTAYDAESDTLIFSEVQGINRIDNIVKQLNQGVTSFKPTLVRQYPSDSWHGAKYIGYRNGKVYVPTGSPCNTCLKDQNVYGTFSTFVLNDPKNYTVIAKGIRNSVGFDWHPVTGQLWFTDNGRDEWGNDRPGDELNVIPDEQVVNHYGFPFCYEKGLVDSDYNKKGNCDGYVNSAYALGPHVAAIGMTFYKSKATNNTNLALIAEHGSWNRQVPLGYRVTQVDVSNPSPTSYKIFIDGWLNLPDGEIPDGANDSKYAWGRPTDVHVLKDGSILIADDKAHVVYKVTYNG